MWWEYVLRVLIVVFALAFIYVLVQAFIGFSIFLLPLILGAFAKIK